MQHTIELEPQPRIDTLVRLAGGREARRTEYAGVAWFDGKPVAQGLVFTRAPNAPRGVRMPNFETAFFVPDSLPYAREALGEPTLQVSVDLRGSGETGAILHAAADFVDDPSGSPTWIQVRVAGHLDWPAGVSYRVVAVTPPESCPSE